MRAESISTPLTWFGRQVRVALCSSSAAAPETIGAAIEVPPARMYWPLTTQVGHSDANALPGARLETMRAPGAWISGLAKPSCVTPRLDQARERVVAVGLACLRRRAPPTEITYGSLPGA